MKRIAVLVVALIVVAGAAWWLTRAKPVAVTVVTVERGAVSATVANTRAGTVDACQRARLSPALGGQIATLPVKDGDRVAKGDLLLELWNEDVKAQLTLSERDARASRSLAHGNGSSAWARCSIGVTSRSSSSTRSSSRLTEVTLTLPQSSPAATVDSPTVLRM